MTKTFRDAKGRRWKAWLATREVFWPDPEENVPDPDSESVVFVCFSDPHQPQRRARIPSGSFAALSDDDLKAEFKTAHPDPTIR
jgi:hypothetical protein